MTRSDCCYRPDTLLLGSVGPWVLILDLKFWRNGTSCLFLGTSLTPVHAVNAGKPRMVELEVRTQGAFAIQLIAAIAPSCVWPCDALSMALST